MSNINPNPSPPPSTPSPHLPRSYQLALRNTFTPETLSTHLLPPSNPTFVYGSLMFPSLLFTILTPPTPPDEIALQMTPATLTAYTRYAITDLSYPAILPSENEHDEVKGFLIVGLTSEQKEGLDLIEAGDYVVRDVEVRVVCEGGEVRVVKAQAYVWNSERERLVELEEKVWTVEGFLEERIMGRDE
ncbi:MAG: hypothetical protein M1812_006154 [Candelaria pacifica]|nr:MAG: hypothetical protein M1812_006154 [Candelaria pacifica]